MTTTSKTIGRFLRNGAYIEITAEERGPDGRLSPGFSVTGSLWDAGRPRSTRRRENPDLGGCIHDEILQAAPELAPLVAAHLADQDGTPMHAEANGWYFYTGKAREYDVNVYGETYADRNGTPHENAARCLHIEPAELPEGLDAVGFHDFTVGLAGRWQGQADAARAALAAMQDGEGVTER